MIRWLLLIGRIGQFCLDRNATTDANGGRCLAGGGMVLVSLLPARKKSTVPLRGTTTGHAQPPNGCLKEAGVGVGWADGGLKGGSLLGRDTITMVGLRQ